MTEGETAKAYAAFKFYFESGDARTLPKVKKQFSISDVSLYKWNSRWRWDERIDAAVGEARMIFRRELEKRMGHAADHVMARQIKLAEANFDIIDLAQAKAKEVLVNVVVKDTQISHDGKNITIRAHPNVRLADAMRLLVGGNIAARQAGSFVQFAQLRGKAGQKPDGSPLPMTGGQESPVLKIWMDDGSGNAMSLTQMPEPDRLDPNLHPDDD